MTRYAIGLGSNLGDRLENLREGEAGLERLGRVVATSALYETEPLGGPEQDPFLNAVVLLETDLEPRALMEECLRIEAERGRERTIEWGPRTLDLDIVATDGPAVDDERVVIPHPLATEREFVLRPLCDVWPEASVGDGLTASEALRRLRPQGVDLLIRHWVTDRPVGTWLAAAQLALILLTLVGAMTDGNLENYELHPILSSLGLILAVLGAVMGGSASVSAGRDLTVLPDPKDGAELRDEGIYGLVRHPMYGGLLLLILGVALVAGSMYAMVGWLALTALLLVKSDYEERLLRVRYPAYASYRRRVPRRLIPGIF
ncbi:MAG: 2-amino-4-hydroxy-6-hydroxymethyldihydropteridine diphosphokinase [Actinomycetes bacterium]|jgi:2-amino-4-hydroxy-6-hydroxymethyldihydropteridine diphosphokinase|nr:MAG: 2-amino-4-hydroxy-6-hydroxymethyldihydropteridine diphosphokinase [Actinomycetota bacterium]